MELDSSQILLQNDFQKRNFVHRLFSPFFHVQFRYWVSSSRDRTLGLILIFYLALFLRWKLYKSPSTNDRQISTKSYKNLETRHRKERKIRERRRERAISRDFDLQVVDEASNFPFYGPENPFPRSFLSFATSPRWSISAMTGWRPASKPGVGESRKADAGRWTKLRPAVSWERSSLQNFLIHFEKLHLDVNDLIESRLALGEPI